MAWRAGARHRLRVLLRTWARDWSLRELVDGTGARVFGKHTLLLIMMRLQAFPELASKQQRGDHTQCMHSLHSLHSHSLHSLTDECTLCARPTGKEAATPDGAGLLPIDHAARQRWPTASDAQVCAMISALSAAYPEARWRPSVVELDYMLERLF